MGAQRPKPKAILLERLPQDTIQALNAQAKLEDRSRSSLIRQVLIDYVRRLNEAREATQ